MLNPLRAVLLLLSLAVLTPGAWAADPSASDKKLIVMLDWFVNPDHAALIVAQEKGFFAAQNLEVELQAPADPNDPPKLAAAGKVDVAVTYQPQLTIHVNAGLPIKRIAVQCGFGSEETLRRSFLRAVGVVPQVYRERFSREVLR